MSNGPPFYDDDAVLLSWGESPKDGAWIKLQIKEDLIPDLRGLKRGAEHGERFTIVITGPLANDENSVARKGAMGDAPTREDGGHVGTTGSTTTSANVRTSSPANSVTLVEGETGGAPRVLTAAPPVSKSIDMAIRRATTSAAIEASSSPVEYGPPPGYAPKPKRRWSEMPPSQRAALRIKEPEFWDYISEAHGVICQDEHMADAWLKDRLDIGSKSDIAAFPQKAHHFDLLDGKYQAWRQARGHGVI